MVNDGYLDNQELDYQQSLYMEVWWEGFFDKQSGVLFYQYTISDRCLDASEFSIPETDKVRQKLKLTNNV